jgi:pimeloyl-ACP methyl ester carboxylesterase
MSFSKSWAWVQPQVATTTRVCAYDRAGLGWSDPGPQPRNAKQVARELNALLANAGINGPYVLAGHSFGGMLHRLFAHENTDDVVDLVLIDARHHDNATRLPGYDEEMSGVLPFIRLASILAYVGLPRLLGDFTGSLHGLPEDAAHAAQAKTATPGYWRTNLAEALALPESDRQVRDSSTLDELPLVILAAGRASEAQSEAYRQAWVAMQEDMINLSKSARLKIVEGADHVSLLTDQEDAMVVAEAILEVVEEARQAN